MDKFSVKDTIVCNFFKQNCYTVTFSKVPEVAITNMLLFSPPVFGNRLHYYILFLFSFYFSLHQHYFVLLFTCTEPSIVSLQHVRVAIDILLQGVLFVNVIYKL